MDRRGRAAAAVAPQLTARLPLVKSGHDWIEGSGLRVLRRVGVRGGEIARAQAVQRSPPASLAQQHLRVLLARQRGHQVGIDELGARSGRVRRQGTRHKQMPRDDGGNRPLRCAAAEEALGECGERHRIEASREPALPPKRLRVRQGACKRTAVAGQRRLPHVCGCARVRGCLVHLCAEHKCAAVGIGQYRRRRRVLQELQPCLRVKPAVARHQERVGTFLAHARCAAPEERAATAAILDP